MEEKIEELKKQKMSIDFEIKKMKEKQKRKNKNKNKLTRVSTEFDEKLIETANERVEKGLDEKPLSKPKLTKLMCKHKTLWNDLKNFKFDNKKGQIAAFMFFGIFVILFVVIYFLVFGMSINKINQALDQDVDIGQVNLQTVNAQTFGIWNTAVLNNIDFWGLATIIGMVLGLFLSAYFTRNKFPKIGIVLDIFIIISVFIFSLYLRGIYQSLLTSLAAAGEPFLEQYMGNTSRFILNLPIYSVVIGVVMAILFHSSIPKKSEESSLTGGTFQAIGG